MNLQRRSAHERNAHHRSRLSFSRLFVDGTLREIRRSSFWNAKFRISIRLLPFFPLSLTTANRAHTIEHISSRFTIRSGGDTIINRNNRFVPRRHRIESRASLTIICNNNEPCRRILLTPVSFVIRLYHNESDADCRCPGKSFVIALPSATASQLCERIDARIATNLMLLVEQRESCLRRAYLSIAAVRESNPRKKVTAIGIRKSEIVDLGDQSEGPIIYSR